MADLQETRRGQIIGAIGLGYLLLLVYAIVTGDPLANLLADALFVVLIIGLGVFVVQRYGTDPLPLVSAIALVASGIAQAVWLARDIAAAQGASTLLLLVGLGIYLYLGRQTRG